MNKMIDIIREFAHMYSTHDTCCFCHADISAGEEHHEECTYVRAQQMAKRAMFNCSSCGQDVIDLSDRFYVTFVGDGIEKKYVSDNGKVIHFITEADAGAIGTLELKKLNDKRFNRIVIHTFERSNEEY